MSAGVAAALSAILSVPLPQAEVGNDAWPHYRGPDRTGAVAASNWAAAGRPDPLWSKNVGRGYSCPSIVAGRLVTMGFDEGAGVDRVLCLDSKTGAELWRFEFAATDKPQYHGGGTLTTPAIAGGLVYCLSRHGKFHVLELATGKVAWARDYDAELKLEKTFHGFCASPIVEGDHIYLQFGGVLAAFDRKSGDLVWQSKDEGDMAYSDPTLLTARGKPAIAAVLGPMFYVFERTTGAVLHDYPWPLKGNAVHCAAPLVIDENRVFLSTAYDKGCAMLQLGDDKAALKTWANRFMRNKVTACVLHDGHLYGFDESMLRCIDTNGRSKWRKRGLGLGALTLAGDRLLILTSDGELIVAAATPGEFKELSRQKVLDGGVYWTTPVLVDGLVYVRNSLGDMRCLDHRRRSDAVAEVQPDADVRAPKDVPAATALFDAHNEAVAPDRLDRPGEALQLRGTWAIPLRGLEPEPMTWTLVAPNRWHLDLDEGGLSYTFDGDMAWAIEPQGPRIIRGEELREHQMLFPLRDLFAPACPENAMPPEPARFAETDCWRVRNVIGEAEDGALLTRTFYFDVDGGRLVGSEGTGLSTLILQGSQDIEGLTLPERITRFRAEDGQEHVMTIMAAEWITPAEDLFTMPIGVQRLTRTPAEIARDEAELKTRFASALGARYQAEKTDTPLRDAIVELRVHDGEAWFVMPDNELRLAVERAKDGAYPIEGIPVTLTIELGENGVANALVLQDPRGKTPLLRLDD